MNEAEYELKPSDYGFVCLIRAKARNEKIREEIDNVECRCYLFTLVSLIGFENHKINHPGIVWLAR